MIPQKVNLSIVQGATFRYPFYWYSDDEVVATISSMTPSYPTLLGVTAHGIASTASVPITVLGVGSWIDSPSLDPADRTLATYVDANTVSLPINGIGQDSYSGSDGRIAYNPPMLLAANWSARAQFRASIDDDTVVLELTSAGGDITLDNDGLIELVMQATDTDLITENTVYDLELVDTSVTPNEVFRVAMGKATLSKQVTRA